MDKIDVRAGNLGAVVRIMQKVDQEIDALRLALNRCDLCLEEGTDGFSARVYSTVSYKDDGEAVREDFMLTLEFEESGQFRCGSLEKTKTLTSASAIDK